MIDRPHVRVCLPGGGRDMRYEPSDRRILGEMQHLSRSRSHPVVYTSKPSATAIDFRNTTRRKPVVDHSPPECLHDLVGDLFDDFDLDIHDDDPSPGVAALPGTSCRTGARQR